MKPEELKQMIINRAKEIQRRNGMYIRRFLKKRAGMRVVKDKTVFNISVIIAYFEIFKKLTSSAFTYITGTEKPYMVLHNYGDRKLLTIIRKPSFENEYLPGPLLLELMEAII